MSIAPLPQLMMRRPRLDDLPGAPMLPAGYRLRILSKTGNEADVIAVAALLARAFDDATWTAERAQNAFLADADVPTTYLIENPDGRLAATASVQFAEKNLSHAGFLHWVGAEPSEAGKRLGYIASLHVLHALRQHGKTEARLKTDDFRLPAIKTYLKLGFRPFLTDASHEARWDTIAAHEQMPAPYAPLIGERF